MAVPVLPYDVEHYNTLPELRVAKDQFESAQASEILFIEVGKAFITHHVENVLGVVLHNHFLLEPQEMLVNVDPMAVPWDISSGAQELADVNASAWRFTDKGIAPYEFAYGAREISLDDQAMQLFFLELSAILKKWDLPKILGICSLGEKHIDTPATMEFSSGRANITLPFDIAPHDGNIIDAMWQFSPDQSGSSVNARPKGQGKRRKSHVRSAIKTYSRLGPEGSVQPKVLGRCKNRCKGKPHQSRHISNP